MSETEEWVCAKLTHLNGSVTRLVYSLYFSLVLDVKQRDKSTSSKLCSHVREDYKSVIILCFVDENFILFCLILNSILYLRLDNI